MVQKEAVADTIVEAAVKLEWPTESPDRMERVSGHSLRVTGAQGLSRLGVDLWSIQLLGRWGSDAVCGYVRDVALEHASATAAAAAASSHLDDLRGKVIEGSGASLEEKIEAVVERMLALRLVSPQTGAP